MSSDTALFNFLWTSKKPIQQTYAQQKEVGCVKKSDAPVVRCEYSKAEKSLSHLVEESFRHYLARILATAGSNAVSCGR